MARTHLARISGRLKLSLKHRIFITVYPYKILSNGSNSQGSNYRMAQTVVTVPIAIFTRSFLIFFTDNIVLFYNTLVKILFCVDISDQYHQEQRLIRNMNLICWKDDHTRIVFWLVIPCMIFLGLVLPLFVAYKIFIAKRQNKLRVIKIKRKVKVRDNGLGNHND